MEISNVILKEIAGDLECGMTCYLHKKTAIIKTILNENHWDEIDTEAWEETIEEIQSNSDDYIKIECMNSHESFELMSSFTESIDDFALKDSLIAALNKSKPFRNFKYQIDQTEHYRQEWFKHKQNSYIAYVKQKINEYTQST